MGICTPKSQVELPYSKIRATYIMEPIAATCLLQCPMCGISLSPIELNVHLGNTHFLKVVETQKGIIYKCMICRDDITSIQHYQVHMKNTHFQEEKSQVRKGRVSTQINMAIRKKVKKIRYQEIESIYCFQSKQELNKKPRNKRFLNGKYRGKEYTIVQIRQQQNIQMDLFSPSQNSNQQNIMINDKNHKLSDHHQLSNLTWKQIFLNHPQTIFYCTRIDPSGQKLGYLLMQK